MDLWLHRDTLAPDVTMGKLYINGVYECEVLEDVYRGGLPKVPGRSAIPVGRYSVALTMSPRFGRVMPLVEGVPGFTGVRIHAGNTAGDTEGCILPGRKRGQKDGQPAVLESTAAFKELVGKLFLAKSISLTISLEPPPNLRDQVATPSGVAP